MQVPFVDLKAQYRSIKTELDRAVIDILERGEFAHGPAVEAFEKGFAEAHGARHCAACCNGTAALHLALWALGLGPGDEVITCPNTFIATVEAILLAGARPVFVDVQPDSLNMDPRLLERALTPRTRAIVPVHLYGQPADLDPILEIAGARDIPVVEDAAQAHLAEYKGRKAGSMGRAAGFSFYPSKNLGAAGEAGAVLTNDGELYERLRRLRDHGSPRKHEHAEWGHNCRMGGIQGAVLGVKLKHLPAWTAARRQVAVMYREALSGIEGITLPQELPDREHVYHLYVIRVLPEAGIGRDELQTLLADAGIGCGVHYPVPVHLQPAARNLGCGAGSFPVAENACAEILSLPMFAEISEEQVERVANQIRSIVYA